MINTILKKSITIAIIFISIIMITGCSKKNKKYIDGSIAIVYKNNKPYLINKNNELYDLSKYDAIVPYFDDILIVKDNNKFGYIKNNGEPITEIIYDEAYPFSEKKAVVSYEGNFHIINETGNIIYSLEKDLISYSYFSENKLVITKDGKEGYLEYNPTTNSFNYLIKNVSPEINDVDANLIYDYCSEFKGGYAVVGNLNEQKQLKYTHINSEGNRLYDLEWDYANNFSEGYAVVGNNTNYSVKVYCGDKNSFDKSAATIVNIMGYMYVDENGNYLGTSSTDESTSETTIDPYVFAMAQDYKDGVGLVARLFFYAEDYSNRHNYDFSTERYFYNYDFINKEGNPIYGVPGDYLVNYNNFGGNIVIYDDFFIYENFYIATYFKSCWYVYYTPIDSLDFLFPFKDAKYDIKDYKTIEEIESNFPWINDYLNDFTIGNNDATYAADKVVAPYTMTNFKQSKFLDNKLVAKTQVYSGMKDSCGIITINIIDGTPKISYLIPPLYEEIIY